MLNSGERQVAPTLDGIRRYFTGKPCKAGHIAERFISNRSCVECSKSKLAHWREENAERETAKAVERVRKWRAANPERAAKYAKNHWAQNKPTLQAQKRQYYQENKAQISIRARVARRQNSQTIDARVAAWRKSNPDAVLAIKRNYRARLRQAEGAHSAGDIASLLMAQCGKCFYCFAALGSDYHVDHMTPLVRGGTNWPDNLCLSCPSCNISKGGKTAAEYIQYRAAE